MTESKIALVALGRPGEQTSTGVRTDGLHTGLAAMRFEVHRVIVQAHGRRWHRRPRQWWYFRGSAHLNAGIRSQIPPDVAIIVLSYLPVAAIALSEMRRSFPGALLIYDAQNDELTLARRKAHRRWDLRYSWNARYVGRLERRVVAGVQGVTVAGLEDLARMSSRYPSVPMTNLPHAVDVANPITPSRLRSRTLFTYGNWHWEANAQGLLRLAAVRDVEGEVRVYGNVPVHLRTAVQERARGGKIVWTFCGFVDTLDEMAEDAACPLLMPVWTGAGVKSRTAQMTGRGVPVFGPRESVRGLPPWIAEVVVVEDRPDELLRKGFDCGPAQWDASMALAHRLQGEYSWTALVKVALSGLQVTEATAQAHPARVSLR